MYGKLVRGPNRTLVTACLMSLSACNRYEMRREECTEPRRTPAQRTDAVAGSINGVVWWDSPRAPAAEASVQLRQSADLSQPVLARAETDSVGAFAFDSIAPGRYTLYTRRIGAAARLDTAVLATR